MIKITRDLKKWVALGVALTATLSSVANVHAANTPEEIANKALAVRYIQLLGTRGFDDFAATALSEDHELQRPEFHNLAYNADDPLLSQRSQPMAEAFPDRSNLITRVLGEDDMVAITYRMSGTQYGNFYGIPATNRNVDIDGAAVFRMEDGKIASTWLMADSAALLRQVDAKLPTRQDGQLNIPPKTLPMRTYDEALAEHLEHPEDSREYRQTRLLLAYKSLPENRPADYQFDGRPYTTYLRSGIVNIVERGAELGVEGNHNASLSDRRDMIVTVISDGDQSMMLFRLTAMNTGELYGIPASGNALDDWELGFARFEGEQWVDGWWYKDELGYLMNIGNEEALNFLVD